MGTLSLVGKTVYFLWNSLVVVKNQIEGHESTFQLWIRGWVLKTAHSESCYYLPNCIVPAEYFLEDCIQMTHFVPPPKDKKKKDKDDDGGEDDDVSEFNEEFSLWAKFLLQRMISVKRCNKLALLKKTKNWL